MNPFALHFVSSYLLLPVLALILGVVTCVIAKKNKLLNNKKVIIYVLASGIILALPGFLGFFDYSFMPYLYVLLILLYWVLGYYNQFVLRKLFSTNKEDLGFGLRFLFTLTIMALGGGVFSLVFNLCNELQYGMWACTCVLPFIFPMLYHETVQCYFDIPVEIYKVWKYTNEYDSDDFYINNDRVMVVDIEFFRSVSDVYPERPTGKVSEDSVFGQWFQRMIDDYNRRSPLTPIVYKNEDGEYYEWIFYIKPSFFSRRKYIDPELTFADNNLKRRYVIIAKRVMNKVENKEY